MAHLRHSRLFWLAAISGIILLECFFPVVRLIGAYSGMPRPYYDNLGLKVRSLMPTLVFFMLISFIGGTLLLTCGLLGVARQYRKIENRTILMVFLVVILIILFLLNIIYMYTVGF